MIMIRLERPRHELLMNDESCFDRFAKANLVRQQNSRCITGSDFLRDKELVWNQGYAWPQKPLIEDVARRALCCRVR